MRILHLHFPPHVTLFHVTPVEDCYLFTIIFPAHPAQPHMGGAFHPSDLGLATCGLALADGRGAVSRWPRSGVGQLCPSISSPPPPAANLPSSCHVTKKHTAAGSHRGDGALGQVPPLSVLKGDRSHPLPGLFRAQEASAAQGTQSELGKCHLL